MLDACVFCKIAAGEIPADKIYEDEKLLAFLDIKPVNPGHALIIPKEHFVDYLETPDEIIAEMAKLAKIIGQKILDSGLGQGVNITNNIRSAAGQIVGHVHMHIIPRKEYDGLELWHGNEYHPGQAEDIASKLRL